MSNASIVKKLSVKVLLGSKPAVPPKGEEKALAQIIGVATGIKAGETNFGVWEALTGMFQGINLETSETVKAGTCFLPDVALDMITGQLRAGANSVEFAFNINVRQDDDSVTGYVYTCTPLIQPEEGDPIARIAAQITKQAAIENKPAGKK